MTSREQIGFIGAGAMGTPIAAALLGAGHSLVVYDQRQDAVDSLVERGAMSRDSVAEVGDAASTVFASLPSPEIVRAVACGEDGLIGRSAVRTFVDLSTIGANMAAEVGAGLDAARIAYVDAPVSGGVAGAEARTLAVMASGDRAVFERVRPLLETFSQKAFWVGPEPGQGQTAKVLNNVLSATAFAITSEAMTLGVTAGLDPATLLEIFNASSGRNTATSNKFPEHVLTRGFGAGFRLRLMAKDVELCLNEARRRQVPMILGSVVEQLWSLAAARAGEAADHTEFVRLYEDWTGVTVAHGQGADELS